VIIGTIHKSRVLQSFTLTHALHLNPQVRRYLYVYFMYFPYHRETQGWPSLHQSSLNFIFFCSNMKYFPFNGKYRENLKCCDELRRLLLDYWHNFQYMWKATHFPVKQKYLLTQTGDVMQNKMWRRLIKSTNKRRIQLSIFSVVLSFIKFSVK